MAHVTFRYTGRQLSKRIVLLLIGLFVMTLGVAMSKKAGIGTTPISCVPATLSYLTPYTMGTVTVVFNAILVLLQKVVLGKQFKKFQILQILMGFAIGILTDVNLEILSSLNPDWYPAQWFWCVISCLLIGFGVTLEIHASLLVAPGEGLVVAFVTRYKIPLPRMKIVFDYSMVIFAASVSLIFSGGLHGVREGTIFGALAMGLIIGFCRKHFGARLDRFLE